MRWVGIDEAGYGPNLGPLVMTAVVAEGPGRRPPDVWRDLPDHVGRAGDETDRLWVDDSKAILRAPDGRPRLDAACLAALAALGRTPPSSFHALLNMLDAGSFVDVEIAPWLDDDDHAWPSAEAHAIAERCGALRSFSKARWKIVEVVSVVVGPARFNTGLAETGSKALVHFSAFSHLMRRLWERANDGVPTAVCSDKHGGRHFYLSLLLELFPDIWIDRGPEGPDLSRYTLRTGNRRLELSLCPRADAENGLVALASIVSKSVRECWMGVFNAHWTTRLPGLRPTAGYPGDSRRFRDAIEAECLMRGMAPALWWREK
jgi:hypothetical protein